MQEVRVADPWFCVSRAYLPPQKRDLRTTVTHYLQVPFSSRNFGNPLTEAHKALFSQREAHGPVHFPQLTSLLILLIYNVCVAGRPQGKAVKTLYTELIYNVFTDFPCGLPATPHLHNTPYLLSNP